MKERKEGMDGLAPLAAGVSGVAALLVGGCGGVSFWVGISSEYLGEIFFSGIPISFVLVLIFLFARRHFLKPGRIGRKELWVYAAVLLGVPVLGLLLRYADVFFNETDENFTAFAGVSVGVFFLFSTLVVILALFVLIPVGVSSVYRRFQSQGKRKK